MESRTQIAGVTVIVDASDFGFKHLRNLSLQDLKHAAMFAQVCNSFLYSDVMYESCVRAVIQAIAQSSAKQA